MAELQQQLRVQEAVDSMVKSLERENIRKMQGLMFRCSAACCEESQASMQQVHQCIERCRAPVHCALPCTSGSSPDPGDQRVGEVPGPPGPVHYVLQ
uniref:Uncharacterized protein n=1 Tax=Rangifer tarandus platyrhynchus TaxID=3082113 RepID=A0ACB0FEU6_RANTA|nr:unnamed protein product [Rangifer tarandus platyrhynchus]